MKPPNFRPASCPPPPPRHSGTTDLKGTLESEHGESTKLTIPAAPPLQFGGVVAKVGDLRAEARVRVTPKLPFVADFTKVPDGRTPAGWVNTQGKFSMVKFDGKPVLMKRNDNPNILVARTESYIAAPNLADYTIQSDVYGTKVKTDMPDIGVGNCRYQLQLIGNLQILKLHTWTPNPAW